jgi:hypothetical protein
MPREDSSWCATNDSDGSNTLHMQHLEAYDSFAEVIAAVYLCGGKYCHLTAE